jgi:hypothetical protein
MAEMGCEKDFTVSRQEGVRRSAEREGLVCVTLRLGTHTRVCSGQNGQGGIVIRFLGDLWNLFGVGDFAGGVDDDHGS